MTTYYKAIYPDGTSFHDSRFRWLPESGPVEGHMVTHPTASIIGDHASQYLSVSVVPTDCSGMWLPLRLLEVEPVGEVVTPEPGRLPNKRAGVAFKIVRELPATDALGPQGMYVAALIKRSEWFTADDMRRLAVARYDMQETGWVAALTAARGAARDAARNAAWTAVWDAAGKSAVDVTHALLVRDLITREHYDALTRPWRSAIGPIHPDDEDSRRQNPGGGLGPRSSRFSG